MWKCDICGKKIYDGMTDDYGDFHVCEGKCFHKYMNKTFGKHKWMELGGDVQDELDGFYIVTADNNAGFEGTGIYYTEFVDDED